MIVRLLGTLRAQELDGRVVKGERPVPVRVS